MADEENRITIPNRRNGKSGSLARGFFAWNSEVGSQSIGAAFFGFDYTCSNRIVWGVEDFKEIDCAHRLGTVALDRGNFPGPDRICQRLGWPGRDDDQDAQQKRVDDDLDAFLLKRFNGSQRSQSSPPTSVKRVAR